MFFFFLVNTNKIDINTHRSGHQHSFLFSILSCALLAFLVNWFVLTPYWFILIFFFLFNCRKFNLTGTRAQFTKNNDGTGKSWYLWNVTCYVKFSLLVKHYTNPTVNKILNTHYTPRFVYLNINMYSMIMIR